MAYSIIIYYWASLAAWLVKNLPTKTGDLVLIPGLGRFPGEGKGNRLRILAWRNQGLLEEME